MSNLSKKTIGWQLLVVISLMLIVSVAAGCAAPAPTAEPAEEKVAEEPAEAPMTAAEAESPFSEGCWDFPAEDVTIEIWWHEYGPFTEYVYELIDRYEQMHPNVNIEPVVASQSDLNQKLTVALASGTGPHILDQDISFYSSYYDKGVLEPINLEPFCAESQAEIEDQYIGTVLEGVTFDGDIRGIVLSGIKG